MTEEDGIPPEVLTLIREVRPLPSLPVAEAGAGGQAGAVFDTPGARGEYDAPPGLGAVPRHPFEVYVVGMNSAGTVATCAVHWGTVGKDELDIESIATITDMDTTFTVAAQDKVWLACEIDADGDLTSCAVKHGEPSANGWTSYPNPWATGKWFHILADIRNFIGGKNGGTRPDSGEIPIFSTSNLIIAQHTNTHLVVRKWCMGLTRESQWGLTPGPGALYT